MSRVLAPPSLLSSYFYISISNMLHKPGKFGLAKIILNKNNIPKSVTANSTASYFLVS